MTHDADMRRPILPVEDNPLDADLTRRAFKANHLANRIEVARDGQAAIGWIAQWDAGEPLPLLILLDLKRPKVDGLKVLRTIRQHPYYTLLPIVVLFSSSDDTDIQNAYARGGEFISGKAHGFRKMYPPDI